MVHLGRFLGSPIFEEKIILKMEETVLAHRDIIVLIVKTALRIKKKNNLVAALEVVFHKQWDKKFWVLRK